MNDMEQLGTAQYWCAVVQYGTVRHGMFWHGVGHSSFVDCT